jgi:hypothetical protein
MDLLFCFFSLNCIQYLFLQFLIHALHKDILYLDLIFETKNLLSTHKEDMLHFVLYTTCVKQCEQKNIVYFNEQINWKGNRECYLPDTVCAFCF